MLLDGINRRLNRSFKTMDEALRYCEDAGINILNVFAMPELDSYTYDVEGYKEPQAALMVSLSIFQFIYYSLTRLLTIFAFLKNFF